MASSYEYKPGSLSAGLSRELELVLLGNAALSEEFFQLLSPLDNAAEVLGILRSIHQTEPALFTAYPSLALAIAVVYDVPPPPNWPHGQVSVRSLPRALPLPEQVFGYLARLDRANGTAHKLNRLPADELKFLVDIVAPFEQLDWARRSVPSGLADLGKAYEMVRYRKDRLTGGQFSWPGGAYTLPAILQLGGICVDQAYFASTVGKAKGIPTLMFRGAGLDGRHAWFGYLDSGQHWQLDCGRFAEQKFVTGLAFDPQTWSDINDHELGFITERFRSLPTYKLSVMHAEFAADYLREKRVDLALKAARESVNRDRRNLEGWDILLEAQAAKAPGDLRAREAILREAVLAFQKYPDLEISFSRRLIEVLRQRGETSLANVEEQRLGRKYQADRQDLSIGQAASALQRSMQGDDLATQIKTFNRTLDTQGRGAAIDFYGDRFLRQHRPPVRPASRRAKPSPGGPAGLGPRQAHPAGRAGLPIGGGDRANGRPAAIGQFSKKKGVEDEPFPPCRRHRRRFTPSQTKPCSNSSRALACSSIRFRSAPVSRSTSFLNGFTR
jgi:hypothetical protein